MRAIALALLLTACDKTNDDCVVWTQRADDCLVAAGDAPAYVSGVDCAPDPATETMHSCMMNLWVGADCSSPENVEQAEIDALTCIPE